MRENRTAGTADGTQQSPSDPTRRDFLIRGAKVAGGAGIAALLGNLGHWALSYAANVEPVKIGILHSLSGTMAISEVSLRDVVLMAAEEINAAGGLLGRPIQPVENKRFVTAFKTYCKTNRLPGGDRRVTDDPIEAAYFGVHVWKQAVERAGSTEVDGVRKAVYGMEFTAPGGRKKMDEGNHHTHKPVLIGEILADGQFKIVWTTKGLIKPEPWSRYTNPDVSCN